MGSEVQVGGLALETAQRELTYGLAFKATVTTATSTTEFIDSAHIGKGDDFYTGYYAYVQHDAGAAGASPQGEMRIISNFVSSTGAFTHAVYGAQTAVNDVIILLHPSLALEISVSGELDDAAATGAPTSTDTIMAYMKQVVNNLSQADGIATWASSAAPGNGVSIAEALRAVYDDTNSLQTEWADGGRLDALIDSIKAETALIVADTNELQSDDIPGTLATILADTNELQGDDVPGLISTLDAVVDTVKAETVTILADTNEIQAELADGGRLDLLIDAILVDTGTTLSGQLTTIDNEMAAVDTVVDAILVDTGTTLVAQINTGKGKTQVFDKAIGVAANAGATTVATVAASGGGCIIESIIVHADAAAHADLTSAAVTGGASNVISFLTAAQTIQDNLDAADKQVAWTGAVYLAHGKTIVITPAGTGSTALDFTVSVTYRASVDGGLIS